MEWSEIKLYIRIAESEYREIEHGVVELPAGRTIVIRTRENDF
jgi:hypothetical protein